MQGRGTKIEKEIDIEEHSRLWKSDAYVLLAARTGGFSIVEKATGYFVVIESDVAWRRITERMQHTGVPVVEVLPDTAKKHQQWLLDLIDSGMPAKEVNWIVKEEERKRKVQKHQ